MKKLIIGVFAIPMLAFSVIVEAEEGVQVYCNDAFSEYQHSIKVDDVVGIAQLRQGFLQIEQKSDNAKLKQALAGSSKLRLDQTGCTTWISNQNHPQQNDGLLARLHFGFDQSNLTAMSSRALSKLARTLRNNDSAIVIDGHTDSKGSEGYNQALGLQRALTTSGGLMTQGVNKNRIVVRSFGESQPISSNSTAEGRAQNRRSEIRASNNDMMPAENIKSDDAKLTK